MKDYVLYRMYGSRNNDWPEELLYVGVTQNARTRMKNHERKWWWPKVERSTLERFATRELLLDAERLAIRTELPLCNIQGNPRYNFSRKDCVNEGHEPPVGSLCGDCEYEKFTAWNWLDEELMEYRIWYGVTEAKETAS